MLETSPSGLSAGHHFQAGRDAHSRGDLVDARVHFEAGAALARAGDDFLTAAECTRWLGTICRMLGDALNAQQLYEESLSIAESAGLSEAMASALNCLGLLSQQRGDVDLAESYYKHARNLAEENGQDRLVAMVDQNLGTLAGIRGRLDDAIINYTSALSRLRELGDKSMMAAVLGNLGILHIQLRQWGDAELCLDDAFSIAHSIRDVSLLGRIEITRADLHLKQRAFEGSRECCDKAFEIFSRAADTQGIADTYKIYGSLYHAMARPGLAKAHLDRAVEIAQSCEDRLIEAEALQQMALVHLGEERNADALRCLNAAHALFEQLQASTALNELAGKLDSLEDTYLQVVERWAESIEAKDRYTAGHCRRVADYAVQLAAACGFEGRDLTWFRMGGFLHDVGKTDVPLEVLNKPGKLTEAEFLLMQSHTTIGDAIVAPLKFPWDIRPLVRSHHEKWDGTGYPDRLKGEEIPFAARILCVADVYDALTSARSYRPALSQAEAFKIMDRESGTTLDPVLYARFRNMMVGHNKSGTTPEHGGIQALPPMTSGTKGRPPLRVVA